MLRILTSITGDDFQLVKQSDPLSKRKIIITASLLLVPTVMWLVNGYLIAYKVLKLSIAAAILTALGCALVILIIEKAIIYVKGFTVNIFRILLGLLIAVIGSIGWDEVIFEKDIDNHMIKYKSELVKERIGGNLTDLNMSLQQQKEAVDKAYSDWQSSLINALSEADGTGGSGIRGISNITKLKIDAANQKKVIHNDHAQKLEQLQTEIHNTKQSVETEFYTSFNDHSLLTRIKVLFDMVINDRFMLWPYILITALLVVLEFIVIIYKIFSSKTAYEHRLEAMEQVTVNRIRLMSTHLKQSYNPIKGNPRYLQAMEATHKPILNIFD